MSSNEIQTNDVNGSRLAEQVPSSGRCSRQGNIGHHHANPVISDRRKWTSQENKIVMECSLLSEPKIKEYRKRMLSLSHQKGLFWVSEQRLVDQANTIRSNSWMTELEIEELERKVTGSDSVIAAEARSVEALADQVGEDRRNVLPEKGAEEQVDSLDEEEVAIVVKIAEVIERGRKDKLPALRNVLKKKLLEQAAKVDKVLSKFKTHSIIKTNELFYAGDFVVINRLGVKINKVAGRKEPMWKRRLQNKIKELRKDLSQLEASKDKGTSNFRHWERLERKYSIRVKRLNAFVEELKQRITAIAEKVRRYQGRVNSYRQNRLFKNNQRQFYRELDQEEERCDDDQPVAEESRQFWGNIWSQSTDHKKDAKWLQVLRSEVNVKKQKKIDITTGSLKNILGRMPNWKSPGPDLVQGFWLKSFSSWHERVRLQLKEYLDSGFVPSWSTRGRTSLLQNDKSKGNVASNYRPITCLPLMWKLLTGVIADQIYAHLDQKKLLPEEQKGCRKGSRGNNDLLYIDRAAIKEVKSRNKNLAMAWIDYKKAYDVVAHSWIIECLDLFGVAEKIKSLLVNSMEKWKVMICSGNSELGEVEIKRGIFQRDSLTPLVFALAMIPLSFILRKEKAAYEFSESKEKINHILFMDDLKLHSRSEEGLDSLVQTVRVFSEDIGIEFGIEKCVC